MRIPGRRPASAVFRSVGFAFFVGLVIAAAVLSVASTINNGPGTNSVGSGIRNGAGAPPPGMITPLVSTCGATSMAAVNAVTCLWSGGFLPPAGTSIVCGGATFGASPTVTGMTISDGFNTYTSTNAGGSPFFTVSTPSHFMVLAYRLNIPAAAPNQVTLTIAGGTDPFMNIVCNAFSDTAVPTIDGTCGFGTTASASPNQCAAPIAATAADYVLGFCAVDPVALQTGAPWTLGSVNRTATNSSSMNQYQVLSGAGSVTPTCNVQTPGGNAGILGVAVKP